MDDTTNDKTLSTTTKRNGFDVDEWVEQGINSIPAILDQIEKVLTVPKGSSTLDYCDELHAQYEQLLESGDYKALLAAIRDTDMIYAQLYMGLVYADAALDDNPYTALSFIIRSVGVYVLTPDWRNNALQTMIARNRADKRWDGDPTQGPKDAIYRAWEKWNTDRRTYPKPSDFRRAMLKQYPTVPDGTLKNWTSGWPQGKNLPKQSSRC